ncbi:MAG: cation diffusion facilitator family transporter [Rickettsiales bacterium]|nr:cation diffusion facilitator family transporter [Rickettsiales bacterium]
MKDMKKENLPNHRRGSHSHAHGQRVSGASEKAIFRGFLITFLFMLIEFVGGYLSGSLALTTDAIHMLVDVGALLSAWAGFYFGRLPTNGKKTFGYQRFEILASMFNSLFLLILTVFVSREALGRLSEPVEIIAMPMFIISVIGLIVNCLVFYTLNQGEREHLNIKGALIHVAGDLLGSVAAISAAVVIYFTGWTPIDPILSILACLLVLNSAIRLLLCSLNVLMEGVPPSINLARLEQSLRKIPNVKGLHYLHVWEITSGKAVAMMDLEVSDEKSRLQTVRAVKSVLKNDFNVDQSSVGIDIEEHRTK